MDEEEREFVINLRVHDTMGLYIDLISFLRLKFSI
jgi:hypothetical protein